MSFAGKAEQDLGDGQAQQFRVGQQRAAADESWADDVVVKQ